MKRMTRRLIVLAATVAAAFVAASPSLAGMNDGGGFYAQVAPASQPTCSEAATAAITALLNGQPVDVGAILGACKP